MAGHNPGNPRRQAARIGGRPVGPPPGSDPYCLSVYDIVERIPAGRVATYGQIAAMLTHPGPGRPRGFPLAARRVGTAMRHAPLDRHLPCHRVVNARGEMLRGDAFGGADAQRLRLIREGVVFRADGHVDLRASLWHPSDARPNHSER
ncbi:MAG: cysteine methyltransferase [Clostridiaceae bacterium]|nr:cysteine methyltransferase [Clostridiaceae bacterium]